MTSLFSNTNRSALLYSRLKKDHEEDIAIAFGAVFLAVTDKLRPSKDESIGWYLAAGRRSATPKVSADYVQIEFVKAQQRDSSTAGEFDAQRCHEVSNPRPRWTITPAGNERQDN